MYCKLSLQDKFVLILPEDIPLTKHRKVLGYYTEFKNAISQEQFYPIEPYGIEILKEWFWIVELIGKEIDPQINWQYIPPQELYRFFIAKIETVDGKIIVERSELEKLLGFTDKETSEVTPTRRLDMLADREHPSPSEAQKTPLVEPPHGHHERLSQAQTTCPPLSTEDVLLDITTITLLNFKQGYQLLQTHSLSQLIKINEYANALQEKAQKDAELKHSTEQQKENKIRRPPPPTKKSPPVKITYQMKAIADKVKKKGIPIPTINND